jgi:hypothetical protein
MEWIGLAVSGVLAVITGAMWVGKIHSRVVQNKKDIESIVRVLSEHSGRDSERIAVMEVKIENIDKNVTRILNGKKSDD